MSRPIPMVDLGRNYAALKSDIDAGIAEVLETTRFIMGDNVAAFEAEAADYLGVGHAVSCANGTDALQLAMRALELGPGDEVITTPFTFIATAEAIGSVGATPVFVDIEPDTWLMDVAGAEAAITSRTRAILPVHLFGLPADMPAIRGLAEAHGLKVIEDCAQSFGATVGGRHTGAFGDVGCFSFFPSKNLGAFGDGGMLTVNDPELARRLKVYRSHGSTEKYVHSVLGCNSRLDELQAAILRAKLPHVDSFNERRRRVAARYDELLAELPLRLPVGERTLGGERAVPVFHQYTLLTEHRDRVRDALTADDIASAIYYPIPLHRQEAIRSCMDASPSCPEAERVSERCLSLPICPELDDESIERVAAAVRAAF